MSYESKLTVSDALKAEVDAFVERGGAANYTAAIRRLVVMGLAVDHQGRNLALLHNPYLVGPKELIEP